MSPCDCPRVIPSYEAGAAERGLRGIELDGIDTRSESGKGDERFVAFGGKRRLEDAGP